MEIRQSNYESTLREWSAFCCSRTSLLSNSHRFRSSWGRQKKQMVEIPLGFHVLIPTRSRERAMQLVTYHQYHLTFLLVQSTQKNIGLNVIKRQNFCQLTYNGAKLETLRSKLYRKRNRCMPALQAHAIENYLSFKNHEKHFRNRTFTRKHAKQSIRLTFYHCIWNWYNGK